MTTCYLTHLWCFDPYWPLSTAATYTSPAWWTV
jgi:hypothetical protein